MKPSVRNIPTVVLLLAVATATVSEIVMRCL
eukprot:COSAG02_NODE_1634_length_11565_cov_4.754666_9_plen_31_part_00